MKFADVIGHDTVKETLKRAVAAGRASHAYLLAGPESVGKTPIAQALAAALLCLRSQEHGEACGECGSCLRLAGSGHPDFAMLGPEGAGEIISIKSLRERVYAGTVYAPVVSARKVFILERADRLGPDAANSLLKTLEEPPSYVHFILTADSTGNMLATILSRCQLIRLGAVSADEIASALQARFELDRATADDLAQLAEGAPGRAISLAEEPERAETARELLAFCDTLPDAKPGAALKAAEDFRRIASQFKSNRAGEEDKGGRLAFVVAFDLLAGWLRDALAVSVSGTSAPLRNRGHEAAIARFAQRGPHKLRDDLKGVVEARRAVLGNGNAQLATEWLFAELLAK